MSLFVQVPCVMCVVRCQDAWQGKGASVKCLHTRGAQTIEKASEAHLLSNAGGLLIVPAEDSIPLLRRKVHRILRQECAVSRCVDPSP